LVDFHQTSPLKNFKLLFRRLSPLMDDSSAVISREHLHLWDMKMREMLKMPSRLFRIKNFLDTALT